jgi:hypothetical protein
MYIYDNTRIPLNSSWNEKSFNKTCTENSQHTFCFPKLFSESRVVYGSIWKIFGRTRQDTDDNIVWCRKVAINTNTHTPIIFNNYCFSTATVITRTRLNIALLESSLQSEPPVFILLVNFLKPRSCFLRFDAV